MARKTRTPRALSITRKLYTYLGVSGLSTALIGKWGITDGDMVLIMCIYAYGGFVIQTLCDTYFLPEKPKDFPKENI